MTNIFTCLKKLLGIGPTTKNNTAVKSKTQSANYLDEVVEHLELREGVRLDVYKDSLGKLTVGVGHLVRPEDNLKLGDRISKQRMRSLLSKDLETADRAAFLQACECPVSEKDFKALHMALIYVNFQLGIGWHKVHKNTWSLISKGKFAEAAEEVKDSRWYSQTPVRVNDFANALKQISKE